MLNYFSSKMINIFDNKNLSKNEILEAIVKNISQNTDLILDEKEFFSEILKREEIGTTGIGRGIAIPHARTNSVKDIVISVGLLKYPMDFQALDGESIKVIVLVGVPKNQGKKYLEILSKLSKIFRNEKVRNSLMESDTIDSLVEAIAEIIE